MTADQASQTTDKYVLSVDIGTTSLRCHIYSKEAKLMGKSQEKMPVDYPKQGYCEIRPETMWTLFLKVCRDAIQGRCSRRLLIAACSTAPFDYRKSHN